MTSSMFEPRGDLTAPLAFSGKQLPSFNEGFGSFSTQAAPPPMRTRCPVCEAAGHFVLIHQGATCSRCNINKRLTPPPDLPHHYLEPPFPAPTPRYNISHLPQLITDIDSPRRSSLASLPLNSDFDPLSRQSSLCLPVPPPRIYKNTATSSSPHPMPTLVTPSHLYQPMPNPPMTQHFQMTTDSGWKPLVQRSEKDTRHCDAEKTRRDHQSAYIDLGFSLRRKFRWPEDRDGLTSSQSPASAACSGDTATSPSSPSSATTPNSSTTAPGVAEHQASENGKDAPVQQRREKLTKQTKLHQQVLWEFRACLRIDRGRVREWLEDVREQGEELRRRKREMVEDHGGCDAKGARRAGKAGKEIRCSKDDAVLEVWELMEREFWERCGSGSGSEELGGEEVPSDGDGGKRLKLSIDGRRRCGGASQ